MTHGARLPVSKSPFSTIGGAEGVGAAVEVSGTEVVDVSVVLVSVGAAVEVSGTEVVDVSMMLVSVDSGNSGTHTVTVGVSVTVRVSTTVSGVLAVTVAR
jgi:hypothetical protein